VSHLYVEVVDGGEHLVGKLGLSTVPTHVFIHPNAQARVYIASMLSSRTLGVGVAPPCVWGGYVSGVGWWAGKLFEN
jgi:hypothetical protein